jgi:hypothetical protein
MVIWGHEIKCRTHITSSRFRHVCHCLSHTLKSTRWYGIQLLSICWFKTVREGTKHCNFLKKGTKLKTKLHGLSPQANYTDRLSGRRLSAKLVPTLADRGVSRGQRNDSPTVVNVGFLDRSRRFLEIAPQSSSRGWVDPVPDPLLIRKNLVALGIEPGPLNL